ncbi:hypothetical protein HP499_20600 [Paenarthrobacter sp. CM16]|uniref:hypothetical protein n=1 Tax=Paenarthrobacter sp. CM16 TaxID=2738447 RepID=UPI001C13232E|nr:hypothetical protein [Paenarthrobacter sp. CM16]NQD90193.1 hypothetical protein [Paenarthrobacter sp. CM16]
MTWQFCDNDYCPESWHWTDLTASPESCSSSDEHGSGEQDNRTGVVRSYFAA